MPSVKAEKVLPYEGDNRHKTEQVRSMFDSIAPAYDFLNRAMTLGIDKRWRAKAVKMMAPNHPRHILDVATGTGDLAVLMARKLEPARIVGIDLSEGMITLGREKIAKAGLSDRVSLRQGDSLAMPFGDGEFDLVTVAYGVRNFEHLDQGYKEMARVLRSGGELCVIELSTPKSPVVRPFYKLYTRGIIPLIGRLISRDSSAYSYLPESIAAVPQGHAMTALMEQAGLTDCRYRPLTLGVCTIYTARKP